MRPTQKQARLHHFDLFLPAAMPSFACLCTPAKQSAAEVPTPRAGRTIFLQHALGECSRTLHSRGVPVVVRCCVVLCCAVLCWFVCVPDCLPGDVVILTSDGIADNFDPVMRKQVLASALPSKSPRASAAAQAAAASALNGTDPDFPSQAYAGLCSPSPASCHARALADMAQVLRSACSPPALQETAAMPAQPPQPQPPSQQADQDQQPRQPQDGGGAVGAAGGVAGGTGSGVEGTLQQLADPGSSLASTASSSGGGNGGLHALTAGLNSRSVGRDLPAFAAGANLTAHAAVDAMMSFASSITDAQRRVLEDAASRGSSGKRSRELADLVAGLPGKLDHACVVAYKVA